MSAPLPPPDPLAGTAYRVLGPLGRGAMGEVFEAEHVALGKRVVAKILHARLLLRPDHVDRMRLEGQALGLLSHPNIVAVTDLGRTADGRPFLVMERLLGRTVRDALAERGAIPAAEAIAIAAQALAGLGAAHAAGIVHRDVKLDNLFLCAGSPNVGSQATPHPAPAEPAHGRGAGIVKILDFGLAKVIEGAGARGPRPLAVPTAEGVSVGTPRFFSPEQASGAPVDARTDLYALGAVLYAMVAGRGPFDHLATVAEVLAAHLETPPDPPSHHAPQPIPEELDAVILRALAKDPAARFQTAESFAEALAQIPAEPPRPIHTAPLADTTSLPSPADPEAATRPLPITAEVPSTPALPRELRRLFLLAALVAALITLLALSAVHALSG
jgi:serine/threonine protein kinase